MARPRELARALAATLRFRSATITDIAVQNHIVTEVLDATSGDRVIEVNWGDVLKPKSSLWGLLRHHIFLITSMVDVAVMGYPGHAQWIGRIYRWLLFTVTPGSVFLSISTAVAFAVPQAGVRRSALIILTVGWCVLSWWFLKVGRLYHFLWPWGLGVLALAVVSWTRPLQHEHTMLRIASIARELSLGWTIVFLVIAAALALRPAGRTWDERLARLALLYVPYIAMNSVTTWLGFVGLAVLRQQYPGGFNAWEEHVLPPPMARALAGVELWTTVAFSVLGVAALALPLWGYFGGRPRSANTTAHGVQANGRGLGAQNGMALLLRLAPIVLVALLGACVHAYATRDHPPLEVINRLAEGGILEIYIVSVWRTLPYVLWLFGPFALVLGVIGDVLFYLQPSKEHPAAIGHVCRARLTAALQYALESRNDSVSVLAHSQGTVIATDVLRDLSRESSGGSRSIGLVTLGSPLDSLYARFLGEEKTTHAISIVATWVNGYRDGDVIAGPIAENFVRDTHMGPGGHTDYWSLDAFLPDILAAAAPRERRPSA